MSDEQRLRALAARISAIAEAPGVSFIPAGDHAHETKEPTTGSGEALLDELARRAARVSGPRQLRELCEWAEAAIRSRTHSGMPRYRSPREILLEDFEGHACAAAAAVVGVSRMTAWRWRVTAGRRPADGLLEEEAA